MFKSIFNVAADVVKIAVAPIEIAADLTHVVTKPVAELAEDVVDMVKAAIDETL